MSEPINTLEETARKAGYSLPSWAIWLGGILLPWGTWVTYTLAGLIGTNTEARLQSLEARQAEHSTSLRVVEATSFSAADGKQLTAGLEARFDRLEGKFEDLRREIDRAGIGKPVTNP